MSTLLLIGKIILIIILIILALLLLVILCILFVPIKYNLFASYHDEYNINFKVTYMNPFFRFKLILNPNEREGNIKIFGFTVSDIFNPKEKKAREEKNKKSNSKLDKAQQRQKQEEQKITVKNSIEEKKDLESNHIDKEDNNNNNKEKYSKLKKILEFLKSIPAKIKAFVQNILDKISKLKKNIQKVKEFCVYYYELFDDEDNKATFVKSFGIIGVLLKHIKPRKVKGFFRFGFDDPSTTGEILGFLSMFYSIYGMNVSLIPVFEQSVFEGELQIKGHIRCIHLAIAFKKIYFDKEIRTLYEQLMRRKS